MRFLEPKNSKDEKFLDLYYLKARIWKRIIYKKGFEKLFSKPKDDGTGDDAWHKSGQVNHA